LADELAWRTVAERMVRVNLVVAGEPAWELAQDRLGVRGGGDADVVALQVRTNASAMLFHCGLAGLAVQATSSPPHIDLRHVLDPHVSTWGEMGHIVLTVLGMVAQMERRFIKERQREGIQRAKGEGVYAGGKRRLDRVRIKELHGARSGPSAIAKALGCSRMQVYRVLQEECS